MDGRRWGSPFALSTALAAALACTTCDAVGFFEICDPTGEDSRVGFYSTGDCVGTDATVFRGHEWLTLFANDGPDGPIFTDEQLTRIILGNRHTDYPKELLVHLDNGVIEYLDALLAYHNHPNNQADHFILRAANTHYDAHQEALDLIVELTEDAVAAWSDQQRRALTEIGKATHAVQDSYSPAHTVRARQPGGGNVAWCLCKLKTFVPRDPGCATDDIEYHDKLDDERRPGHLTALDSIYQTRPACLDPRTPEQVDGCMIAEADRAVVATRDYLVLVRELAVTDASPAEIETRLQEYFDQHFALCELPAALDDGRTCDRPPPDQPACPG